MEPEGSLPHSQGPATCPYPEADQSSPCPHPTSWRSILILSSHLRLGLPSGLCPSDFPTETLYTSLFSPYVLHVPPISFFSTWSPEQYLWGCISTWWVTWRDEEGRTSGHWPQVSPWYCHVRSMRTGARHEVALNQYCPVRAHRRVTCNWNVNIWA